MSKKTHIDKNNYTRFLLDQQWNYSGFNNDNNIQQYSFFPILWLKEKTLFWIICTLQLSSRTILWLYFYFSKTLVSHHSIFHFSIPLWELSSAFTPLWIAWRRATVLMLWVNGGKKTTPKPTRARNSKTVLNHHRSYIQLKWFDINGTKSSNQGQKCITILDKRLNIVMALNDMLSMQIVPCVCPALQFLATKMKIVSLINLISLSWLSFH